MKRLLLLLSLTVLTISCAQKAQDILPESIDDNLYRFGVNTSPYEYFNTGETPVPAGYEPFYISHYGRHGSRSDWGDDYGEVVKVMEKAKEAGVLTDEGESALHALDTTYKLHNGMNGRLTPLGAKEHRQIAGRMYEKYKKVFRNGGSVRAVSSYVPRCLVSMAAFTGELLSREPGLDISWDTGEAFMNYCSSEDPDEIHDKARAIVREYAGTQSMDTVAFAGHLFTDEAAARAAIEIPMEDLMYGVLYMARVSGAFELDRTLIDLFSTSDLEHFMRTSSLQLYLTQCNSVEFGDIRMAVPEVDNLVKDFIEKADEAISKGDRAADLRFGHDYQLLAFSSRLGVKGIGERMSKEEAANWPGWLYTPFAGNLQMIFYKNKSGDVIVKCFINERETTLIGLPDGPYYPWKDVKGLFKEL